MEFDKLTLSDAAKVEAISRIRGVIFDVDGTLYNQSALRRRIVSRILAEHWRRPRTGLRLMETIKAYRQAHEELRNQLYSMELQLAAAAAKCGYSQAEVRATVEQWFEREALKLLPQCVYPEVAQFLGLLSRIRINCGAFSDYPAEAKLSVLELRYFFSHVLCAAEVGRQKPDPTGLLTVAKRLAVAPECALYIGDRTIDLEAAAKAGMQGILVRGRNSFSILHTLFANRGNQRTA